MNKTEMFKTEINYIKDEKYKNSLSKLVELLPDYFFEIPASSTGKYHPKFSLGNQGLVRHTKAAVRIALELLNNNSLHNFSAKQKDLILTALILHDGLKSGNPKEKYSRFDHPNLICDFIEENMFETEYDDEDIEFLRDVISSHMGEWNTNPYSDVVLSKPTSSAARFVHMCDYLSSRKFLDIEFNNNEIEN